MGDLRVESLVCPHQENPSAPSVKGCFLLYNLKIYCLLQKSVLLKSLLLLSQHLI